jgi:hypothetical protein
MIPGRADYTEGGQVLLEKDRSPSEDFILYAHDLDRATSDLADWVLTPGVGASLWQKAAVYAGPVWLQPDVDVSLRIEPGRAIRRPHPEALRKLVAAGFSAPKHYITWAPNIASDMREMLGPIFRRFSDAYVDGSYPLFLMLGGPVDLSGPCSMGWIVGGIDLYLLESDRWDIRMEWGAPVEIDGRMAFRPPFLRGAVLYVRYLDTSMHRELDLEVCDIMLIRTGWEFRLGCSERSILSLLTGMVRGWANISVAEERAEKYAARGYEMRLGSGGSAGIRNTRFPYWDMGRWWAY